MMSIAPSLRRLLPIVAALTPIALARAEVRDPSCGSMTVVLRENVLLYPLPHGFLRTGSDSVVVDGAPWRRGSDYAIDRLRGELRLLRVPVAGETLHVTACWLLDPPPLELWVLRYRPIAAALPETLATPAGQAGAQRAGSGFERAASWRKADGGAGGASLALAGNKTIAVDFGSNQDAFLRQSLDLALSGTLAPGVELTGVLSDRNTPLTAGGSTQDIESLDRVLIELKAPRGAAALGDVGLTLDQGEFARVERRIQGMSGQWSAGDLTTSVAAASAPGEFHRLQFFGVEGRQGPYLLTDKDGGIGVSIVGGSEVVTLDGQRLTRGESADYAIDYERARITFSNRRPIGASSRITVEYQYAVNRYRRNLLAAGGRWKSGNTVAYVQTLSEGDDRGRPLDLTLSGEDRQRLEAAGDSVARAFGEGVAPGTGDYDTLTVGTSVVFVYAGPDSGRFAVQFARVAEGAGEYRDRGVVDGRTVFEYVGAGQGTYRVGRPLPLPESHRLWSMGGGLKAGIFALDLEGAVSQHDRNLFSRIDDGDDRGEAGRLALRVEGATRGFFKGTAGLEVQARAVGQRFAPFGRLERPFAEEDWGLPVDADLEHQQRVGASGFFRTKGGALVRAGVARLSIPSGFSSLRRELEWSSEGKLATRLSFERSEGTDPGRAFASGGRERMQGAIRWRLAWLEPGLRGESDVRRTPSDTGRVALRSREAGVEIQSGRRIPWRALASAVVRRDAVEAAGRFEDRTETRSLRVTLDSPTERSVGVSLMLQSRALEPITEGTRTRSDLGGLRLRGEDRARGLSGHADLEITAEGENRRERRLVFVGAQRGGYDALGNFVGTGDYDLVLTVSAEFDRLARAATSVGLGWQFGQSDAWRGSQLRFDFESEARRLGTLHVADPWVSPGAVVGDPDLARGSVTQRIEAELAPGSRVAAIRLRAERRVSADRSFANFAETQDDRTLSARWRGRPAGAWTSEVEGRLRRQAASQALAAGAAYERTLVESGAEAQLVFTPDARLRAAFALDGAWSRPESRNEPTRTLRFGPQVGVTVGQRGRAEILLKRAFVSGPPALALLPSAEPAGAADWEGSARFDYRVRETVHCGLSMTGRDRRDRDPQIQGRAELKAFF
jgi:hypothetical protein